LLGAVGLGAGLSYFLDPYAGRRRRAWVRDKLTRTANASRREVLKVERGVSNRGRGVFARLRSAALAGPVSDEVLEERVRAAIGRWCSHTGALDVLVVNGHVVLRGPILSREHRDVVQAARRVRGARTLKDELEPHVRPESVPGLQDGHRAPHAVLCGEVMKRDVQSISEQDLVSVAAGKMTRSNLGFLPVCDQYRRVIGTLTDRDIVVRAVANEALPSTQVRDVMTRKVVSCRPDDDLVTAERFMAQHQVSRLVITDEDGVLAGVISLSDIVQREPTRAARTLLAVAARESAQF
jgi:CBS domain-containing protein